LKNLKPISDFTAQAREIHGDTYSYRDVIYKGVKVKVTIICQQHGNFSQTPGNHISRKAGCPKCAARATGDRCRRGIKEFIQKATEVHQGIYGYSKVVYESNHTPVTITCTEHGDFSQAPADHLDGHGCQRCAWDSAPGQPPRDITSVIRQLKIVHNNKYDYDMESYTTVRGSMRVICPKHGEFISRVSNMLLGTRCPVCQTSKPQEKILDLIKSITHEHVISNDRKALEGKELDIFIPNLNLAFEIHGIYWHSSVAPKRTSEWVKWHQRDKLDLCKQKGIRLVQYFEDEIANHWESIEQQIRLMLGSREKVFARNTKVRKISWGEAKEFLTSVHLQGAGIAGQCWGLYRDTELLSVMVFTHARPSKDQWELSRFASKGQVVGGASKLLTAACRELNPQQIISYSDDRFSEGGLYQALGFSRSHTTMPDYMYVLGNKRIHKSQFSRRLLPKRLGSEFNPELSEAENCEKLGVPRIYNCGITKWTK
jgi:hypothetical protein